MLISFALSCSRLYPASTMRTIPKFRLQGPSTFRALGYGIELLRGNLRPFERLVGGRDGTATVTHQHYLPPFDGYEGNEKQAQVVVDTL